MTQEIIGSEPSISEIKIRFEKEFQILIKNLESISKQDLENILEQQKISQKHVNTRPGAMACLLYTSPSPRDLSTSRMPSSA